MWSLSALHKLLMQGVIGAMPTMMIVTLQMHRTASFPLSCLSNRADPGSFSVAKASPPRKTAAHARRQPARSMRIICGLSTRWSSLRMASSAFFTAASVVS